MKGCGVCVSRSEQAQCKPEHTHSHRQLGIPDQHLTTASINIWLSDGKAVPNCQSVLKLLIYWTVLNAFILIASEVMKYLMCPQKREKLPNINNVQPFIQCKWSLDILHICTVCVSLPSTVIFLFIYLFWPENCCWSNFLSWIIYFYANNKFP